MPLVARRKATAALAALALSGALAACGAPRCRNTVAHRVASPDGQHDAVVYHRDCGAGDGASSGVAILPHDADLPDLPTTVLTLSQPVDVTATWASPTELRLAYPRSATVIGRMATSPDGVALRFQPR